MIIGGPNWSMPWRRKQVEIFVYFLKQEEFNMFISAARKLCMTVSQAGHQCLPARLIRHQFISKEYRNWKEQKYQCLWFSHFFRLIQHVESAAASVGERNDSYWLFSLNESVHEKRNSEESKPTSKVKREKQRRLFSFSSSSHLIIPIHEYFIFLFRFPFWVTNTDYRHLLVWRVISFPADAECTW